MPYKDAEKQKEAHAKIERERRKRQSAAKAPATMISLPAKRRKISAPPAPAPISPPAPPPPSFPPVISPSPVKQIESAPPISMQKDIDSDLSEYTNSQIDAARDMIHKTLEVMDRRGWIMWKCAKLNNDMVVVVKDSSVREYPAGYPIYTLKELNEISGMTLHTIKMIHALKLSGVQDALPGFFPEIIRGEQN